MPPDGGLGSLRHVCGSCISATGKAYCMIIAHPSGNYPLCVGLPAVQDVVKKLRGLKVSLSSAPLNMMSQSGLRGLSTILAHYIERGNRTDIKPVEVAGWMRGHLKEIAIGIVHCSIGRLT